MKKSGWITRDGQRVVNYRRLLNRGNFYASFVNIDEKIHLTDFDTFKGFIVASTESLFLKNRQRKQAKNKARFKAPSINNTFQSNWDNRYSCQTGDVTAPRHRVKKIKNEISYFGRVYNLELSRFLGLSERTISRWRESSIKNKFNRYNYKRINLSSPSQDKRDQILSFDGVDRAYFCNKSKAYMLCDLVINTKELVPYFSRYYDSRKNSNYVQVD